MRTVSLLLIVAVAVGAALRLAGLDGLALTHWDEGSYVAGPLHLGPYARGEPVCLYAPPLYPALCGLALSITSGDPRAAIFVAALFGIAGIVAAFALTRAAFGRVAGLAAAWLTALDPLQILHARMALTETTFTTLVLVQVLLLARALRTGGLGSAVGAGVAAGLATATKFHGGFPLAVAALVAVVEVARAAAATRAALFVVRAKALLIAGLSSLPFVAWVALDIRDTAGFERFLADRATWVNGLHPWTLRGTVVFLIATLRRFGDVSLIVLPLVGAWFVARRGEWRRGTTAVLCGATIALFVILVAYRNYVRLMVPFAALLVPLAAAGVARFAARFAARRALSAPWAVALAVLACAASWRPLLETIRFRGDGYPQMAAALADRLPAGDDPIVFVGQHALYPYLTPALADRVVSAKEARGRELLSSGAFEWLLTDQDPARNQPIAADWAKLAPRVEEVLAIDNAMPAAILFDRLGDAGLEAIRKDREDPSLRFESKLRLFRLRR